MKDEEGKQNETKPLLVYDGDCRFCGRWIARWKKMTGDGVDYLTFEEAALRHPSLAEDRSTVKLAVSGGRVYGGAEAVFRLYGLAGRGRLLRLYERVPGFAAASEGIYRLVANHREFFLRAWRAGEEVMGSPRGSYFVRWLFLRSLGVIYLIAFLSLGSQVLGLVGSDGILPAADFLKAVKERHAGDAFRLLPTIFWLDAGDAALQGACRLGAALALLLILDVAPSLMLAALWALYLSLLGVGREFLSFQWDILLLETGFLAVWFAPGRFLPNLMGRRREGEPSPAFLFLLRFLLFRLMLASGLVKLASGDPAWRSLAALGFHYETQPLPVWVSWYARHLPDLFHKVSVFGMFVVELVVPFLIFASRPWRLWACGLIAALQVFIMLTGNYCFFNLLALALCLLLLDDDLFRPLTERLPGGAFSFGNRPLPQERHAPGGGRPEPRAGFLRRATLAGRGLLALALFLTAIFSLGRQFLGSRMGGTFDGKALQSVSSFRLVNTYGLFAVMTQQRPEIVVEGSNDGTAWTPYEFKWKPGDVKRRPRFVAPHQPRLDWQMWFAALSGYQTQQWFFNFLSRLLHGKPEVLALLDNNPFPDKPPRYLRAVVYAYRFTDPETRRKDGAWWARDLKGLYCPVVYLKEN